MNEESRLKSYLSTWKDEYSKFDAPHLTDEALYQMAEDGGMEKAGPEAFDHLSLCPVCMEKYAAWREAISAVEEDDDASDSVMSHGLLKAAATPETREAISSHSSCGRFVLSLSPPLDKAEKWLVTLEVIKEDDESLEGRFIEVRDRNGIILLEGKIHQGRLARFRESLTDLDLSAWALNDKLEFE